MTLLQRTITRNAVAAAASITSASSGLMHPHLHLHPQQRRAVFGLCANRLKSAAN